MRIAFDAVVVGAGPAGSSAAILLARAGWDVALVEKQLFPRRKVCGECIAASNLPLLDALGIGADVAQDAGPALHEVMLMRGDRAVTAGLPTSSFDGHRFGRALGRETLDTSLLEQARRAGVHVFQPWSIESIDGSPGEWHFAVRAIGSLARSTLHAPVAIDAHGSWEGFASSRAGPRARRRPSDLFAFKANFHQAALPAGRLAVLSFDGGYGGMVLAGHGITTVACCVRRDRLETWRAQVPGGNAGDAVETFLARECGGVRAALAGASRDGPWLASGPLDPGIRARRPDDPFRIGNAAGEAHPIIGEGMSMALQSAWLLCAHLIDPVYRGRPPGPADQRDVGRRVASEWRRHFGGRLRLASLFAHSAMRPTSATLLMTVARRWPGLLTAGAIWGGKVRSAVDGNAGLSRWATAPSRDPHEDT